MLKELEQPNGKQHENCDLDQQRGKNRTGCLEFHGEKAGNTAKRTSMSLSNQERRFLIEG
jgi:hypothetical protein